MSSAHTAGRLEVADGRRIGVVLPSKAGGGFDSHCVALAQDSGGRLDAEANARRLAACWNACDGMGTDALEAMPAAYMLAKLQMVMPLFQEARDALTVITEAQRKLHGISPALADRMDEAGTFSVDDWRAAITKVKVGAA